MSLPRPLSLQPMSDDARVVFKGKIFDVYQWDQELFDGTKGVFEKIKRLDTGVVFPVFDDGKILLTIDEQPGRKPMISTAGGRIERGEDVIDAAKRELLEETGYEASELLLWDAQQPMIKVDWAIYTFVAKGLKKVAEVNLDAGEKIEHMLVSFDEFIDIALQENFLEKHIVRLIYEAKLHPEKMEGLRRLFCP